MGCRDGADAANLGDDGSEVALVDFAENQILHATPDAWRLLGWQGFDATANRRRLFPAEAKGPLPAWL